ncbi:uncharacterized protein LOC133171479 [Saccostrea echinata]|uniref:uncharacterized protein LOC133171479 n=1 Tax=Saccostrea echinata TaxID=191078 RepID=UPI002A81D5FD|nr:uncharacterized protein LOC133171479 [Saccostrea echinata]XP_061162229.1 uncharacterized protein LOC133171479 [Saccostrea echinata]
MRGICHFQVLELQRQGKWWMNVSFDKPTHGFQSWIMKTVEVLNEGQLYRLRSKYEYHPRNVSVEFIIDFYGAPPKGVCNSNIKDPNPLPPTVPAFVPPENCPKAQGPGLTSAIQKESVWSAGSAKTMTAFCDFEFAKDLKKYCITVDLDQQSSAFSAWFTKTVYSEPNGLTYTTRNRFNGRHPWIAYAPGIQFKFQMSFKNSVPNGNCTLYTWD